MKRVAQERYTSLASSLTISERTSDIDILQVARKIRAEMKHICSTDHSSIIQDSHEAVKRFSWETIWLELLGNVK